MIYITGDTHGNFERISNFCTLMHTVPLKYEPVEVFLPGIDQSKVNKATEEWLDSVENRLHYDKWYAGHYHTTKRIDNLNIMYQDFECLCEDS